MEMAPLGLLLRVLSHDATRARRLSHIYRAIPWLNTKCLNSYVDILGKKFGGVESVQLKLMEEITRQLSSIYLISA